MTASRLLDDIRAATLQPGQIRDSERKELLAAMQSLQMALETPVETIIRYCFAVHLLPLLVAIVVKLVLI